MDAMQKRRMWKVAIVHFALTVICMFAFITIIHRYAFGSSESPVWSFDWMSFWGEIGVLLQPQLFLLEQPFSMGMFDRLHFPNLFVFYLKLGSIPLWSICFGWIYVKFTNWLNHFPTLGKRVF
jgi:hypothetical protein